MRKIKIGNIEETVVERADFPPEKLKAILSKERSPSSAMASRGAGSRST